MLAGRFPARKMGNEIFHYRWQRPFERRINLNQARCLVRILKKNRPSSRSRSQSGRVLVLPFPTFPTVGDEAGYRLN